MDRTMDDLHGKVLRRYHTLCAKLGLSAEQKYAIAAGYGVESSKDIDTHDLLDICARLSRDLDGKRAEEDKLRKRAMASIGQYLSYTGREGGAAVVKAIACRVTGYRDFNKIPAERLRNICYTFNNKMKDMAATERETRAMGISMN